MVPSSEETGAPDVRETRLNTKLNVRVENFMLSVMSSVGGRGRAFRIFCGLHGCSSLRDCSSSRFGSRRVYL